MSSEYKNPFEILGISRKIISDLSDEELLSLAASNYRFFARKYHPDMNPASGKNVAEKKFNEIRDAYETICSSVSNCKKLYSKGTAIENLEKELEKISDKYSSSLDKFAAYILPSEDGGKTVENGAILDIRNNKAFGNYKSKNKSMEFSKQVEMNAKLSEVYCV
ncbi:MAG: DnaJ domain-containing protein, partial [Candidatus Paceibacterota bacterium]